VDSAAALSSACGPISPPSASASESDAAPRGRCQPSSSSLSVNSLPSSTVRPGGGKGAAPSWAVASCKVKVLRS